MLQCATCSCQFRRRSRRRRRALIRGPTKRAKVIQPPRVQVPSRIDGTGMGTSTRDAYNRLIGKGCDRAGDSHDLCFLVS